MMTKKYKVLRVSTDDKYEEVLAFEEVLNPFCQDDMMLIEADSFEDARQKIAMFLDALNEKNARVWLAELSSIEGKLYESIRPAN